MLVVFCVVSRFLYCMVMEHQRRNRFLSVSPPLFSATMLVGLHKSFEAVVICVVMRLVEIVEQIPTVPKIEFSAWQKLGQLTPRYNVGSVLSKLS